MTPPEGNAMLDTLGTSLAANANSAPFIFNISQISPGDPIVISSDSWLFLWAAPHRSTCEPPQYGQSILLRLTNVEREMSFHLRILLSDRVVSWTVPEPFVERIKITIPESLDTGLTPALWLSQNTNNKLHGRFVESKC